MDVISFILTLGLMASGCIGQYPYQELRQHLLKDYDKHARPVRQSSKGILIETSFTPIYLSSLDPDKSVMTMQGWISFKWKDEFLKWDPSSYSRITFISVPSNEIWKPDLAVYNSVPLRDVSLSGSTNLIIYNDGNILWVPAFTFETLCTVDRNREVQRCNITIGSWTESEDYIDFKFSKKSIDTSYMTSSPAWKILEAKAKRQEKFYDCCKEAYVSVSYIFDLVRIETSYINVKEVMCGTTLVSIILTLAMFWLPSDSDKKFTLGSLSVLILAMLLHLGHTSKSVLAQSASFTKVALFVVVIAILIEIVIVNVARMKPACKTPNFAALLLSGTVGRILLLMPQNSSRCEDAEKNSKTVIQHPDCESKEARIEWNIIATALDRAFFFIFLVVFIVERSI